MNRYKEMRDRHQKEYEELAEGNVFYAFTDDQFDEGMRSIGLDPEDTDKIYRGSVGGMFYRRGFSDTLKAFWRGADQELREAVEDDKTGDGFIYDMFVYELGDQEFLVTYDTTDAVEAAGFTPEEIEESPALKHGLDKAVRYYKDLDEGWV